MSDLNISAAWAMNRAGVLLYLFCLLQIPYRFMLIFNRKIPFQRIVTALDCFSYSRLFCDGRTVCFSVFLKDCKIKNSGVGKVPEFFVLFGLVNYSHHSYSFYCSYVLYNFIGNFSFDIQNCVSDFILVFAYHIPDIDSVAAIREVIWPNMLGMLSWRQLL